MSGHKAVLCGDFGRVSATEQQEWQDAAARHLTKLARDIDGKLLSKWKQDEQLNPARVYIKLLLESGIDDLSAIVTAYTKVPEKPTQYARTE